jgi:uncharacterized phage-associated protein
MIFAVYVVYAVWTRNVLGESLMTLKTYSAQQIAKFFLSLVDSETNDVSNLKLQKLCYYAQGVCSAMRGKPLFQERVLAWDHGPVVPDLYHAYKRFGSQSIDPVRDFDPATIDEPDRIALDAVYRYYGQFSPWRLRNMTHDEAPWRDAYDKLSGSEIPVDAMEEFFHPQIDSDFVKNVYGQEPSTAPASN